MDARVERPGPLCRPPLGQRRLGAPPTQAAVGPAAALIAWQAGSGPAAGQAVVPYLPAGCRRRWQILHWCRAAGPPAVRAAVQSRTSCGVNDQPNRWSGSQRAQCQRAQHAPHHAPVPCGPRSGPPSSRTNRISKLLPHLAAQARKRLFQLAQQHLAAARHAARHAAAARQHGAGAAWRWRSGEAGEGARGGKGAGEECGMICGQQGRRM